MSEGIDCLSPVSAAQAAQLVAAGKTFVLRYIGSKGADSLSPAERETLHAAGLDVGLIYETTGTQAQGGAVAGEAIATQAVAAARVLGAPAGVALLIAETDFNPAATGTPLSTIVDFYNAAEAVCRAAGYRCGGYGGLAVAQAIAGDVDEDYQTYAWSAGQWAAGAVLEQYENGVSLAGLDVDLDRALIADWGQWPAHTKPLFTVTVEDSTVLAIIRLTNGGAYLVNTANGIRGGIDGENSAAPFDVTMDPAEWDALQANLDKLAPAPAPAPAA